MPRSASVAAPVASVLDRLMTPAELAQRLGLKETTLADWRSRSVGPKFIRIGNKFPRYLPEDVDEWLLSQRHQGTAEER